ncbi:MAG: hypothetical protein WD556_08020 [Actinomycetota bacterium]
MPLFLKALSPPAGSPSIAPPFVQTPVWPDCNPVRIVERDGQHVGFGMKALEKVVPEAARAFTLGIFWSVLMLWSSGGQG